jgi:hypothetical protein
VWLAHSVAVTQSTPCDPFLLITVDNPFGYHLRGDRCEGLFVQQVSSTPLLIASLVDGGFNGTFSPNGSLELRWAEAPGDVRLRAHALKPRTYYQMDARQPAHSTGYRWKTDVLSALNLVIADIGIVAWTEQKVGGVVRNVYLPLRIGTPPASEPSYELAIIPDKELAELYVGVVSVPANGATSRAVTPPKPLNYGYYAAGRTIRIPVGPLPAAGLYRIDLGATLVGGGAISHEVWLLHRATAR